jgi:hypothetical protein
MALQKGAISAVIALAATGIFLTIVTSAVLFSSQNVPLNGTVSAVNVGVYTNADCTINCTNISAGTVSPGSSHTYTVYVKNTGNEPVTLSMTTSGWNPSAANGPITLTWNRNSYTLNAGASISATLTLSVSPSISNSITEFGFNIIIAGTA